MAWETRDGKGRYFTLSGRANGRVTRTYYGAGLIGEFAEAVVALRRKSRAALATAHCANQQAWDDATRMLQQSARGIDLLVDITLLTAGYHQHCHGDWRAIQHADHGTDTPT